MASPTVLGLFISLFQSDAFSPYFNRHASLRWRVHGLRRITLSNHSWFVEVSPPNCCPESAPHRHTHWHSYSDPLNMDDDRNCFPCRFLLRHRGHRWVPNRVRVPVIRTLCRFYNLFREEEHPQSTVSSAEPRRSLETPRAYSIQRSISDPEVVSRHEVQNDGPETSVSSFPTRHAFERPTYSKQISVALIGVFSDNEIQNEDHYVEISIDSSSQPYSEVEEWRQLYALPGSRYLMKQKL